MTRYRQVPTSDKCMTISTLDFVDSSSFVCLIHLGKKGFTSYHHELRFKVNRLEYLLFISFTVTWIKKTYHITHLLNKTKVV